MNEIKRIVANKLIKKPVFTGHTINEFTKFNINLLASKFFNGLDITPKSAVIKLNKTGSK